MIFQSVMVNMEKLVLMQFAFTVTIGICPPASAQFSSQLSGLAGLSGEANFKGNIRDIDAELKAFAEQTAEINRQVFNALRTICIAYEDADGAARESAITGSLNDMTDPKAQLTRMEAIKKADLARVEQLKNSSDTPERARKLGGERQKQIVAGVEGFLTAAARATDLIKDGQSIIRYVSLGRMNMATVAPVKTAMPSLTDTRDAAANLLPEFIKVLNAANLQVPEVTANRTDQRDANHNTNQRGQ